MAALTFNAVKYSTLTSRIVQWTRSGLLSVLTSSAPGKKVDINNAKVSLGESKTLPLLPLSKPKLFVLELEMFLHREAMSFVQVGELTKSCQEDLLDLWINLLNSFLLERKSSLSVELLDLSSLLTSRLSRPSSGLHHIGWRWVAGRIVTILQDLLRAFWRLLLKLTARESRRAGVQYDGLNSLACDSSMQLVKRLQSASFKANARLPRSTEMFPRVNSILR